MWSVERRGPADDTTVWQSCKTNMFAYDDFVVAMLCLLHHKFPDKMGNVTTNGCNHSWQSGLTLDVHFGRS
eukprot:scaffold140387_cov36-Tisochrysis_lutea.AAC.1